MGVVSIEHQVRHRRGHSGATMARLTKLRLTWVKYDQRFAVTGFSDAGLHVLQREIHRLMGRCLLLVQTYERLMKAVMAQHDISGRLSPLTRPKPPARTTSAARRLGPS